VCCSARAAVFVAEAAAVAAVAMAKAANDTRVAEAVRRVLECHGDLAHAGLAAS
jgi:hypothetical protein